ncbi:nucleotidyltransferase domain-containing protein [Candidatus Woesearchaeota archaeon]|nr:nucleotidyltransferase domain-containing protein [Candidatus Woesearchaeota archaeon]
MTEEKNQEETSQEEKKPEKEKHSPHKELDISKIPNLSKEAKEKLEQIKKKLDKFKKEVLDKFDKYIMGITLLPPRAVMQPAPFPAMSALQGGNVPRVLPPIGAPMMPQQKQEQNKEEISVLVLVNDSDSKKMSKYELKTKLGQIIGKIGKDIDPNMNAETIILSEVWQSCYDAKYDMTVKIAAGTPVYDTGMLAAIKISEIHKQMVLKKFERYIVCYVLAGSLVQGKASPDSDIDVFLVIDDTDVKKMTRVELKDKLRAIIIGMGLEAGEITGIRNKLNIQVYILTDFWDNVKEANPIIFTFLRDGIPFYDRGIFMPWKQLLQMGKVKPSQEAIDIFMSSGDQMMTRVQYKLKGIGMEDTFYAILTPSQAAIMLYGVPPPTPKETPDVLREIFVKKEKLLEDEYVKILERNIKLRKELEHGSKKDLTGKELDQYLADAQKFLKRIKKLFKQIDKIKEEESLVKMYENTVTVLRDILKLEGTEKVKEENVIKVFEDEIIDSGKVPHKYLRMLKDVVKAKEDYDEGKLSKTDITKVKKDNKDLHKFLIEYIQRKRGREIEKAKIRVKHGKLFGEVILLGSTAYLIHDIDAEDRQVSKADIDENGSLKNIQESSREELEHALASSDIPSKVFIKQAIFTDLKEIFGKDVEVMLSN